MTAPELHVVTVEQTDPRLGRQCVHDPRSRNYPGPRGAVRRWRTTSHRIFDPRPNPNQKIGNCTGCAEAMLGNIRGNRVKGVVLDMDDADRVYSLATQLDPWDGQWPPADTGSSGTAAAQAAVQLGIAERYDWYFGLEHALDGLQQRALSVGTWWYEGLFRPDPRTKVARPTGAKVGGHQWMARAYDASASKLTVGKQLVGGACWWGEDHYFWITVDDFAGLLADDGDVHHSYRAGVTG